MTPLRRAPREVYRVYDEDEFLAVENCSPRCETPEPSPQAWRMRRLAGPTLLLAVSGLVGALIAIAGISPGASARRRAGGRLLAATDAARSSRTARVSRRREGASVEARPGGRPRDRLVARVHDVLRAAAASNVLAPRRVRVPGRSEISTRASAPVTTSPPVSPVELATVSISQRSGAQTSAGASAGPRRSGQSEFGFEH